MIVYILILILVIIFFWGIYKLASWFAESGEFPCGSAEEARMRQERRLKAEDDKKFEEMFAAFERIEEEIKKITDKLKD